MDKVAVLIPVYNEEMTLLKVIDDFYDNLPEGSKIYVYDNNSTDKSYEIAVNSNKAIVRKEHLKGKGNVIRRMFREIDAKIYVMVDADDTYNAKDVSRLIAPIVEHDADMIVGDRLSSTYFTENKRRFHNFGNVLMKFLINTFFKSNVDDIMSGYRAFSRRFVKTYPCLAHGFEVETEMTIHCIDKNLLVENVVVDYKDRQAGSVSKLNTIADGIKVILTFLKYFALYRPFIFFNFIAIILFVISAAMFIPILIEFKLTHLVSRFPTLIVCVTVFLSSIQCFFTGITLELINKTNRQEFEYKLINEDK